MRPKTFPATRWFAEVGNKPLPRGGRGTRQLRDDFGQCFPGKTIEKEVGDDEVVRIFRQAQIADLRTCETHARVTHSFSRQRDHARTCFDAIDFRVRIRPDEFSEEATVPLAHHQNSPRRAYLPDKSDSRLLELIAENHCLERAIKRRNSIEAHRNENGSASSGVSKTRSARAVRVSRGRRSARFSLTSRSALAPRHNQSGKAKRQAMPQARAATAMP